ncbi:hypothetical protein IQ07DRAFT_682495 [Pyrenochaeta sp. DS3sAY3a]|nr:hypothetical protein IQ07DRAFT_682495 [Pyrenochaeta sp. DS3sAY3a]
MTPERAFPSPCPALRPSLAHRLYSHRLHVRAKAKLHRDRLLSGPMIDVYVGKSRRHWALHRNLLCHHSELLESELEADADGNGRQDTLELPDHDPAGFELLVKWLYQGTLDDVSELADASQKYDHAVSCHKLYLLCDRFDMPQLKNVAMDQYRKGLNQAELVPDADEIDDIYRKSPKGSPFRQLMTRIAARQIMDPASDRDVETYRECFENSPDFAIDLVKAIRLGTGGVLFDDPTDPGNECEYHDHEAGPNCHTKGKGKVKQAKKTPPFLNDLSSNKLTLSTSSDQQSHRPRLSPLKVPRQLPPRQARPQDGISTGPLRRRLTSPASSTVGTSKETAIATQPPNPDMTRHRERDRERLRKVTPPERQRRLSEQAQANGITTQQSRPVLDEPLQSFEDASHQAQIRPSTDDGGQAEEEALQKTPSRRGIWEWARAGTGRLSIIGRLPHPEWKGPVASKPSDSGPVNGSLQNGTILEDSPVAAETQDDFSIPSTTNTEPDNEERKNEATAAKIEGLGISNVSNVTSPFFSQTKRSSDELVAASSTTSTPAKRTLEIVESSGDDDNTPSAMRKENSPPTPDTPTPRDRRKETKSAPKEPKTNSAQDRDTSKVLPEVKDSLSNGTPRSQTKNTPSPHRIPKYKIALTSSMLSPARTGTAST